MAPSLPSDDATLGEWLSAHARHVSARRLALDVGVGGSAALLVALWQPAGWPALLGAALCFVAFGAWAAAERRLAAHRSAVALPPVRRPPADWSAVGPARWRVLRAVAAVVGVLAATVTVFGFLFGVLGTWIS